MNWVTIACLAGMSTCAFLLGYGTCYIKIGGTVIDVLKKLDDIIHMQNDYISILGKGVEKIAKKVQRND